MQLSAIFLFAATVLAARDHGMTAEEQSKANLERIKEAATTATANQQPQTESKTSNSNEQFVTERIVHHTPPHMMIMLQQKHPHVYLEVLKIKEQVMVDEHMKVLGKEAVASEQLYRVHRDGSRTSLRSRLFLLTPKHADDQQHAMAAGHDEHDEHDDHQQDPAELDWFDKLALALHLDHFWPRLLFSLSAGFSIVSLGFLILHIVGLWLGWNNENIAGKEDEYAALLNPNFRGPGVVSVHHYHDQIERSAKMESI